jgi:ATP-binding protein involved in chromosome partitioning
VSFRTYRELPGSDRSGLGEQVDAQRRRVRDRLRSIRRVVAVTSGKGGVGKSYVAAALAVGMARRLRGVGVLDADLTSPTVARTLAARGPLRVDDAGVHPAVGRDGIVVVSTDLLLPEGAPLAWTAPAGDRFVWRGVREAGVLRELLGDVAWGALELLVVDMPPVADRIEDLAELVPDLAGAVAVTIPSEESRRSVERAMRRAVDVGVRLLGVVENMSGYECAACGTRGRLFDGGAGAALAAQFGVPLLASLPFSLAAPPAEALAAGLLEVLP